MWVIVPWKCIFKNTVENEYRIKSKSATPGNPQEKYTIKILHQTLGNKIIKFNIEDNFIDEVDLCMGIPAVTSFLFDI